MDRVAKSVRTRAGAKAPAARKARPPAVADGRSVERRLADALAQQAATAEILRVMAASPTDVQPVMQAVAEHAARLCRAEFARVFIADAGLLRPLAHYASDGGAAIPAYAVPLQRTSISGRAAVDRVTVHHADVVPLLETEYPDARENARETGLRAVLAVPLMHEGSAYGAIFLWRRAPGLFAPDHVALVETFATQAAIAIANVRLFQATRESLEQQTATSEILRVISRSQTDVQPVFDTIVSSAVRLCGSQHSLIFSLQDEVLKPVARHVMSQEFFDYWASNPLRPGKGSIAGWAALERRTIHVSDVAALAAYEHRDAQRSQDFHTVLAVPLLRDDALLGVIVTWKTIVEPFSDKQVELIETFADQAVIAIENVRLFTALEARNRDLTEALEQQTATSEILRVISQSQTDVQPVFQTIATAALGLCRASSAVVATYDGEMIRVGAIASVTPEGADAIRALFPRPASRDNGVTRTVLTRALVHDSGRARRRRDTGRPNIRWHRDSEASSRSRCCATAVRSAPSASAAPSRASSPTRRSRCCRRSPTRR